MKPLIYQKRDRIAYLVLLGYAVPAFILGEYFHHEACDVDGGL